MMSGVDEPSADQPAADLPGTSELSLDGIAASIGAPPDTDPEPSQRPADRLAELVQWWAQVAPSPGSPPKRVDHLWADSTEWPLGSTASVSARSFDPPATRSMDEISAWAVAEADAVIDAGADLVLLAVPVGAGASAPGVLAASVLALDAVDAAGWPSATGMSDVSWMVKVTAIRDGLRRLRGPFDDGTSGSGSGQGSGSDDGSGFGQGGGSGPQPPSADETLRRLGDRALTAGCAVLLRCASRRTPVLLEGLGAASAALFAQHLNRAARPWWQFADGPISAGTGTAQPGAGSWQGSAKAGPGVVPGVRDPLHDRVLAAMDAEPITRLGLSWPDGTAGRIAFSMLETAIYRASR